MRRIAFGALIVSLPIVLGEYSASAQNAIALPQARPGDVYSAQLAIPPGLGYPFTCNMTGLPKGLTFDCARLQIAGRAPAGTDKTYSLTLKLADNQGNTETFALNLPVSTKPVAVSLGSAPPSSVRPSSGNPASQPTPVVAAVSPPQPQSSSSPKDPAQPVAAPVNSSSNQPGQLSPPQIADPQQTANRASPPPTHDAPTAPTIVKVTISGTQATIAFTQSTGGVGQLQYVVASDPPDATGKPSSESPITVSGLKDDTVYSFSVIAKDDAGQTSSSTPNSAVVGGPTIQGEPGVGSLPLSIVPIQPPSGYTAKIDVVRPCSKDAPSILAGTPPITVTGGAVMAENLADKVTLAKGDTICVLERFSGTPPLPDLQSVAITIPAAKTADELESEDALLRAKEAPCVKARDASCLESLEYHYLDLADDVENADKSGEKPTKGQHWEYDARRIEHARLPNPGFPVTSHGKTKTHESSLDMGFFSLTMGDPTLYTQQGDLTGNISHLRVMGGVDVSAAASSDIAARFLLDGALDMPLGGGHSGGDWPISSRWWAWADARIASMQSPGTISSASTEATYVSSLTGEAPNQIVQSLEAYAGPEFRLGMIRSQLYRRPIQFSLILDGGIITPLSASQSQPAIYQAPLSLQQYYVNLAASSPTSTNKLNAAQIESACMWTIPSSGAPTPPTTTATCYVADVPEGRSSFFRDYAVGFRFKRYYFNNADEKYIFPAEADFTVGQNEYVTGGMLRNWVLHVGGSTPIRRLGGVYVYAAADVKLAQNVSSPQYLLQPAPSTVTATSSGVAQILVNQPNRDRYRFGIGFDVSQLCAPFHLCSQGNSGGAASSAPAAPATQTGAQ